MISFAGIDGVKMISNVAGFPILPIAILATISMIKGMARAYREGDAVETKEELAIRREKMKQMAAERKAAKKDKKAAANA
jgi:choline-glycine betaine transporter